MQVFPILLTQSNPGAHYWKNSQGPIRRDGQVLCTGANEKAWRQNEWLERERKKKERERKELKGLFFLFTFKIKVVLCTITGVKR